jgi:hypothetical protein
MNSVKRNRKQIGWFVDVCRHEKTWNEKKNRKKSGNQNVGIELELHWWKLLTLGRLGRLGLECQSVCHVVEKYHCVIMYKSHKNFN